MLNVQDYELRKTPEEPRHRDIERRSVGVWIAAALLIAAMVAAIYIVVGRRSAPTELTGARAPVTTAAAPSAPAQPLGANPLAINLPPLGETDPLVRELVRGLSSHPSIAAWLATDNLVRNFTVVVANIADKRTPARHLSMLRPSSSFRVLERGDSVYIDPRSYERYNSLAAAAASIDPAGSARLYATVKPRIEEAYRELGVPDTPFDRVLENAIVVLLNTPVVEDPIRIEPRGIGYAFADPKLEALTPPQKQLMRTGSRNVRVIQDSLRKMAEALGIPAERLPAAR
jgi:hypothetical protein